MKLQRVRHNLVTGQQQQQQYLLVGYWLITPKCYECGKAFIRSVSRELPGNSVLRIYLDIYFIYLFLLFKHPQDLAHNRFLRIA